MPGFNKQQQNFIVALGELAKVFKDLSENNDDLTLIRDDKKEELSKLKEDCESMFEKLSEGKFTVAVVGLENSGKSTLGNSLIGIPDLLPTSGLRCTFTVTKALAGSKQNEGEVSLYTYDEFNEKFAKAVEKISTLNPKNVNYSTITWAQINAALRSDANSLMVKDVKAMIDNRDNIQTLLTKNDKHVHVIGDQQLRDPSFRQYITGQDPNDINNGVEPPRFNGYPYAVKEITIWSTAFQNMTDIVLYDVPGFNSITALHKDQTDKMINEADAVILIVDLMSGAQITSTHLDIFKQKEEKKDNVETVELKKDRTDRYGTKYKDKVFVFGNMADLLVSSGNITNSPANEAGIRKNALINSVEENNISDRKYIVCGSAFLYDGEIKYAANIPVSLQNVHQNLIQGANAPNPGRLKTELSVLTELVLTENVTITDAMGQKTIEVMGGVKLLVKKLEDYYYTARYNVLTQRIDDILKRARKFLEAINIDYEFNRSNDGGIFYYDASENLDNFVREAGNTFKKKIKEIKDTHPFSNIFDEKKLEEIFPTQDEKSETLRKIVEVQPLDADNIFPEGVQDEFRKRLFQTFVNNIKSEIMKKEKEVIYVELKRIFLKNMGLSEDVKPEDKVELEQSVDELFNELLNEPNWAENGFIDLRGDLFLLMEVLIRYSFSQSRITKVFEKNNFLRLSTLADFYVKPNASGDNKKQRRTEFFTQILLQQSPSDDNKQQSNSYHGAQNVANVQARLETFFEKIRNEGFLSENEFNLLPLQKWAENLVEKGKTFQENDELREEFKNCITETDGWKKRTASNKIELLNDTFEDYIEGYKNETVNMLATENRQNISLTNEITQAQMTQAFNKIKLDNTQEYMLKVLNTDIENLRTFASEALVHALNIEGGFISLILKDVDTIRFARNNKKGNEAIRNWVAKYIRKIRAADFENIENIRTKNERRNAIATGINNALNKLKRYI